MRLGGWYGAGSIDELQSLCEKLDAHGLSAIGAPGLDAKSDDECAAFGEAATSLGIVIGETGMWRNLMTDDADLRRERVKLARTMLAKADIMGCHCVVSLVGTKDPSDHPLAPHPHMHTEAAKAEFREIVLRILDGLDLKRTRYVIEPWHNAFFYQPEDIRQFIDSVGHPAFGLHLDQMNMVSQESFYDTAGLIDRTFGLLADKVASVHLKDIRCDYGHMFLKWDEVDIGDGVMDYDTYLRRLAQLPPDTPCFCEHMPEEADYVRNFARLHERAARAGTRFLRREEE